MAQPRYTFRAVEEDDLDLLASWLDRPHNREWWGDPEASLQEIRSAMEEDAVEPMIAEIGGRPIAYVQTYDPHLEDDHPYQDQPFGTLGIDISIGEAELLGMGHGSAILKALCGILFEEGATRVVVDPDPDNARAIRAYEKAGFTAIGPRNSIYGPAILMAMDNPDE